MRDRTNELHLDFSDVLILPKTSTMESRSAVDVRRTFEFIHAGWEWSGVPIIAANMDTTGTVQVAKAIQELGMLTALHKHYDVSYLAVELPEIKEAAFYSLGTSNDELAKLADYSAEVGDPAMICVDVANGYTMKFLDVVRRLRDEYSSSMIMAGNVVTAEKTEQVILAGADCVKVGIGPGSVCTTRKMTGVGRPQLSAIIDCADAAHGVGGLVCADGGCTVPGDVVKAFAAGADFVMVGGMFAGTAECGGERLVKIDDEYYSVIDSPPTHVRFYGMSSRKANDKYAGGLNGYRAAEGKEVIVPYKGPITPIAEEILGGLRSAMTYVGAVRLKELTKRATFIRVNNQINNSLSRYDV